MSVGEAPRGSLEGRRDGSAFGFGISIFLLALLLFAAELRLAGGGAGAAGDLAAFAAALAAAMLAARAWGCVALSRLEIEAARPLYRAFAGERVELRFRIRNQKMLSAIAGLEPLFPESLAPVDAARRREASLPPFGRADLAWTVAASRRGLYRIGAVTLAACDPLGLHSRERTVGLAGEVVVFPRVVPTAELELPFRDFFGIHPSAGVIEDPAWYAGTREYSGRKPAKAIHWKASARLGILQEKIYEPTSQLKAAFLLDGGGFLSENDGEGLERAIEVLASAASRLAEMGASFAAAVDLEVEGFPSSLPFARGSEHLGSLLELLARCAPRASRPLPPLPPGISSSSAALVVVARSPGQRTRRFAELPAARHGRILFLLARGAELSDCPAVSFGAFAGTAP